jgi:2-oxoisovalerate dehydrogenase E1 component
MEVTPKLEKPNMTFDRRKYDDATLIRLYKALLKPRLIEERMLIALRQGKISKWFSGVGQEAISVGIAEAIESDEYLFPMHRNLGLFTSRKLDLKRLFCQFQGKKAGYTKGRDRSFHFGANEHHIVGMISHLGPQLALADGVALANKLDGAKKITVTFTGDGATSEGDFHEALNVAAVWDLPVIFVIENNGYGLSTPSSEQFRCKQFIDKGKGYGMDAIQVDGNNVLEVFHAAKTAAEKMRKTPKPLIMECLTFRMRGHEESSGTKYIPKELFEIWGKKDPIGNYEAFLITSGVISEEQSQAIRKEIKDEIETALQATWAEPDITPDTDEELRDVYFPYVQEVKNPSPNASKSKKRFIDAVQDALAQSMERFPDLVLMGQDIAEYGGAFKVTEGFVEKFGKKRVRNTPLCESAIVGVCLGMSIKGKKTMMEMQFADFVTCGFNQIVNNLAKSHWRWGQNADVVVRMPTGAGTAAGPFHSQSNEAWFFHTPGLKIVYPSNPYDAKGLLNAALEDPNPYMFFEHKALYRSISDEIPDEYYTVEVGKAALASEGTNLTIVTYGMGVHWAKKAMEEMPQYSADIVDLRTLLPWDKEAVMQSVKKTNKVLVCHEDCLTGGIGAEIAAWISENCFRYLDAPVMREGALDTPIPFSSQLEQNFLPAERIKAKVKELLAY